MNNLPHPEQAVVIGAFGCTSRYVARRLLEQDVATRTLTRNLAWETPFGGRGGGGFPGLFRPGWAAPVDGRGRRPLQHLLDSVRARKEHLRPGGGKLLRRCSRQLPGGGRRQDRPFLRGQRFDRIQAALLPGQGAGGGDSDGYGVTLRHHPAHPGFWGRRSGC